MNILGIRSKLGMIYMYIYTIQYDSHYIHTILKHMIIEYCQVRGSPRAPQLSPLRHRHWSNRWQCRGRVRLAHFYAISVAVSRLCQTQFRQGQS